MAVRKKTRIEPLNVFYGLGAAVLLTGAMFKFLNLPGANQMLFVGLTTEAFVFIISGFERQKVEVDYQWDKIFPQLTKEGETNIEKMEDLINSADLDPEIMRKLSHSIEQLEQNVAKMSEISNASQLTEHIDRMKLASEKYESEITRLNSSIAEMNKYYERMLNVMSNKA